MLKQALVMLDFETTGLSPAQGARITEVAALRIVDGRISERFVSLVNCGVRIPAEITALTGISQAMVNQAPSVEAVLAELRHFIGTDALAAHNASFDAKFLQAEYARQGWDAGSEGWLCSLLLARRLLPGQASYSLSRLAGALGLRFQGRAHRAEADAEVSAQLLVQLTQRLCATYAQQMVEIALLRRINQLSAAKVPAFLRQALAAA